MKFSPQKPLKHKHQSIYDADLIDQVYSHLPRAFLANTLISFLLVAVLWSELPHNTIYVWTSALWLIVTARYVQYFRYRARKDEPADKWARQFSVGVIITGIVWGSSALFLFSENSLPHQVFLAFALGGMVAGATTSLSGMQWVLRVFVCLLILPILLRFFFIGGEIYYAMGAMLIIYGLMCTIMSSHIHKMLIESIHLRYENIAEIEERKKAEGSLVSYKDQLEETVESRTADLQEEILLRKKVENNLRQINERYYQITNNLPGLVYQFMLHKDGSYSMPYISDGVQLMFGVTSEEVIEDINSILKFLHPEDSLDFERSIAQSAESLEIYNHNFRALIEGNVLWINARSSPKRLKNGDTLWDGILFDITALKKMEEEKAILESQLHKAHKLEAIGVLAGGIAHDFNNLLAAILGSINLALFEGDLNSKIRELLSEAEKASLRAKDLTQQLLTFSRGGEPVKETSSLGSIIKDSASFVLHGEKVNCRFDIPENLWCVDIDKGQMSQVFQNIVINASQAMSEGGTIAIACQNLHNERTPATSVLPKGNFVKLSIQDTGVGIPENELEKIFDPYFSTKQEGNGLGLAITHSIISKHDGHIQVDSTPGKGTIFTIFLPATEQSSLSNREEIETDSDNCIARIIVMDDEEQVRNMSQAMLTSMGHETVLAKDGDETLTLYEQSLKSGFPIDLIIMDLTIPGGMGGKEAIQRVLSLNPEAKVIVSSGYSTDPIMSSFQEYGFCGALVKPYQRKDIASVINETLTLSENTT